MCDLNVSYHDNLNTPIYTVVLCLYTYVLYIFLNVDNNLYYIFLYLKSKLSVGNLCCVLMANNTYFKCNVGITKWAV
jgi:hypothetical protein